MLTPIAMVRGPSSWIARGVFKQLDKSIQKKFVNAMNKGMVSPKGQQGIIKLSPTEDLAKQGYTHKLKILGKGGDLRIYGKQLDNGHIVFDRLTGH
ncbi:MAG: hypothetical protein KI790_05775 [Cyclobacteriaceae bacterium]|nr:hypothetical protein [Cyclobacteriaceae bacterium HetDA_MAG_MS6]